MFHLQKCGQPVQETGLNMNNHGLVDHNLHTISKGMPNQNGPNADKWCIGSTYTDVMGVLEPSLDSEGIGIVSSSPSNDQNCGIESTGSQRWQVV